MHIANRQTDMRNKWVLYIVFFIAVQVFDLVLSALMLSLFSDVFFLKSITVGNVWRSFESFVSIVGFIKVFNILPQFCSFLITIDSNSTRYYSLIIRSFGVNVLVSCFLFLIFGLNSDALNLGGLSYLLVYCVVSNLSYLPFHKFYLAIQKTVSNIS